jgi:uncharacterized membrane protein (DUF106 family)
MMAILNLLAPILGDVLKKVIPDSDKKDEIEREIRLALLDHTDSLEKVRGEIVLAEAKSGNWLTSAWRPLLMMVVVVIIAFNYLVFPVLGMMTGEVHTIFLPDQLWNLLTIGVGGYVVGRSGEKMIDNWKR